MEIVCLVKEFLFFRSNNDSLVRRVLLIRKIDDLVIGAEWSRTTANATAGN